MKRLFVIVLIPLVIAACSIIDDDMSVCGEELMVNYQLQLHTELSLQLQAELMTEMEEPVRKALQEWLDPIFTDIAKDIDLRFYSRDFDDLRHLIQEVINDNRTSYTIYLPQENYMHLGVANIAENYQVQFLGTDHSETMEFRMPDKDIINPLNTGLFTARLPMNVDEQTRFFDVHLYMVNAAVAVVLDVMDCPDFVSAEGVTMDCAESFMVKDSVFSHAHPRTFLLENLKINYSEQMPMGKKGMKAAETPFRCLATVCMPTPDDKPWHVDFVTTMAGGETPRTTLEIDEPLKAGTLRIIRCRLGSNGEVVPLTQGVGASVELDWKEGGGHTIDI